MIKKYCLTVNKRLYCVSMQVGSLSDAEKTRLKISKGTLAIIDKISNA